jgi:hypothetical protein
VRIEQVHNRRHARWHRHHRRHHRHAHHHHHWPRPWAYGHCFRIGGAYICHY